MPKANLRTCAVTGTNGKTTVTHMLYEILTYAGYKCAVVGTLGVKFDGEYTETGYTTPPKEIFSRIIEEANRRECDFLITEASSHALAQDRLGGLEFEVGIFTNFSRDHLDYHKTPGACAKAKSKLFRASKNSIINYDDDRAAEMAWQARDSVWYYSLGCESADFFAKNIAKSPSGVSFDFCSGGSEVPIKSSLYGDFSVYNMLAATAAASVLGIKHRTCAKALENFRGVEGRMERVETGKPFSAVVDFAHTPDAVKNALSAAREFTSGKLICVFGCGGERDKEKRPQMCDIACKMADTVIITEDNSRSEKTSDIIEDVLSGAGLRKNFSVEESRSDAIRKAIALAKDGDTVMVLGKGHEKYIERGGEKIPFSDAGEIRKILEEREGK